MNSEQYCSFLSLFLAREALHSPDLMHNIFDFKRKLFKQALDKIGHIGLQSTTVH